MTEPLRPSVLLALPDPRSRLRVTAALRGRYDLVPIEPGGDPLRAVRAVRPRAVLLQVRRGQTANALRACRAIKTDAGNPPLVALVDPRRRLSDPVAALQASLADGYLGDEPEPAALRAFMDELLAGRRPVRAAPVRRRGLWRRLRGR
ncbi:MAG: hypothetical protein D6798_12600 [Deltaproteobacteria bacterium]|nr:MAG: hypothetical protein D6798_12600 [Deltaproteobacteria bacterium]